MPFVTRYMGIEKELLQLHSLIRSNLLLAIWVLKKLRGKIVENEMSFVTRYMGIEKMVFVFTHKRIINLLLAIWVLKIVFSDLS